MKISSITPFAYPTNRDCKKGYKKECVFKAGVNIGPSEAFLLFSKSIGSNILPEGYRNKPCLYVDKLISTGKGTGTEAIKKVVRQSLSMPECEGRVTLLACGPGGEAITAAGFYYKLGFRAVSEDINQLYEGWLKCGGKKEYCPKAKTYMYLPKENIEHCLNYSKK